LSAGTNDLPEVARHPAYITAKNAIPNTILFIDGIDLYVYPVN
jgi:hypothetical protein